MMICCKQFESAWNDGRIKKYSSGVMIFQGKLITYCPFCGYDMSHECDQFNVAVIEKHVKTIQLVSQMGEVHRLLYKIEGEDGKEMYIQYCPWCGIRL